MLNKLKWKWITFTTWYKAIKVAHKVQKQLDDANDKLKKFETIVNNIQNKLTEMDTCDIDVSAYSRSQHTIILTGRYKNQGYVRFYDVGQAQFNHLVQQMRDGNKHGYYRNIDAPQALKACFKWD